MNQTPEKKARDRIDKMPTAVSWTIQDYKALNLAAAIGVAVREYSADTGPADYVLLMDRKPVGIIEARQEEEEQRIVVHEPQADGYTSVADEMGKAIEELLARSELLRQSVLKQAFEGRLVK